MLVTVAGEQISLMELELEGLDTINHDPSLEHIPDESSFTTSDSVDKL